MCGLVGAAGRSRASCPPRHQDIPVQWNRMLRSSSPEPPRNKKTPDFQPGVCCWWRRRESNPRPQALRLWLYMLIRSIDLIAGYPTGRENRQRAWQGFNESAPGALHRDPISGDSRDPVVWARSRAEGFTQVFKLLKRSCRRWQLKFCNQFYELSAARHAPRVSLPASKPGRPQEFVSRYQCTASLEWMRGFWFRNRFRHPALTECPVSPSEL
jgi:hypothetical protein